MRNKKVFGAIFAFLGLLLIAAAFWITIGNLRQESLAGSSSASALEVIREEVEAEPQKDDVDSQLPENLPTEPALDDEPEIEIPEYLRNPEMEMPVVEAEGREYIGILEIPALNLALPVMSDWSYPKLRIAPCRYQGSAYLNNLIIMAHNYNSHFGRLLNLGVGDEVYFTDAAGNVFSYQVIELETLPPNAVTEMTTGDWDLTLFTCTLGGATRVTVRCERANQ